MGYERCSKCSGHGSTTDTKEKRRSPVNGFVLRGTQVTRYTGCSFNIYRQSYFTSNCYIIPAILLISFHLWIPENLLLSQFKYTNQKLFVNTVSKIITRRILRNYNLYIFIIMLDQNYIGTYFAWYRYVITFHIENRILLHNTEKFNFKLSNRFNE